MATGRFLSLQARITLSVGVATTIILAAFGYIAAWSVHESTSVVLRYRLQVAEVAAGRVAETFASYRHDLENLAWELSQEPDLGRREAVLRQWSGSRKFAGLAIMAPGGRTVWSQPAGWLERATPDGPSAILAASSGGAVALSPPETMPAARLATFVIPLEGSGRFLVGAIDLARVHFASALREEGSAPLDFEVIGPQGIVLASAAPAEVGHPSEHLSVVASLVRERRAGIVFHNMPGHPHYVAYTPLPGYPGWAVNVEQPQDVVLSLPHELRNRMALLGLAVVAGMSLLAFLDVRSVIRPLARLREAADRIAGGDLDHPVQVGRKDEVGTLAQTFEAMRGKLKTSREEIAAWNRELEERVAGRTRELTMMVGENARLFAQARRDEHNLASTVDLLSDGLLTLGLDRRILSLNPAAERLLGWRSEEARGLMCTELVACSGCHVEHAGADCLLQTALESGGAVRGVRVHARRRSGDTFPALLTAGLGRDEAGRPTHFIVTVSDRTTEEAYERKLQEQLHQLTVLHEIAQGLNLLPLRTVAETAQDIARRIADATGGGCRLDLAPRGQPIPGMGDPAGSPAVSEQGEGESGVPEKDAGGMTGIPLVLQGRRIGTLWFEPGPLGGAEVETAMERIIASQVAVAVANAELYEDLGDRDALRRQLLERIVIAQEEERRRIARELHDEIGQALTALVMQLGTVEKGLPPGGSRLRDRLAGIRTLTSDTVGEVRRLMMNLRPAVLDDLGLVPAIRWYVESHLPPAGVEARVSVTGLDEHDRLPRRLELVAFRLTQEAVTNVLRHAQAARVTISLERRNGALALSISDDGRGFDAAVHAEPGRRGGWGLVGMQERVALLGGTLTVASRPRRGTRVTAVIPIGEEFVDGD